MSGIHFKGINEKSPTLKLLAALGFVAHHLLNLVLHVCSGSDTSQDYQHSCSSGVLLWPHQDDAQERSVGTSHSRYYHQSVIKRHTSFFFREPKSSFKLERCGGCCAATEQELPGIIKLGHFIFNSIKLIGPNRTRIMTTIMNETQHKICNDQAIRIWPWLAGATTWMRRWLAEGVCKSISWTERLV